MTTTIKFQRQASGSYTSNTKVGLVQIWKDTSGKWNIAFPDGKASYRRSYSDAKAWAEKYVTRLIENPVKPEIKSKQPKQETLKQKLAPKNAYVIGAEYAGCINSGMAACILHIIVEEKSYYLVGKDNDVTDTLFDKNTFKIIALIKKGIIQDFTCPNGRTIKVFSSFTPAEKAYRALNDLTVKSNEADLKVITEAKARIKAGTATEADYFELADRGVIFTR